MITHKPKNKTTKQFPYLNIILMFILLVGFALLAMYSGQTSEMTTMDAEPPVISIVETVDLSGEWVGTGTEDYGKENRYDLHLTVVQNGNTVSGMQFLETSNNEPEIYASSQIQGQVDGTGFYYVETQLIQLDNTTPANWCLAAATLTYENIAGQDTLVGTWSNGEPDREECNGINGRVILTRQPK